jgi:hypothetical protein
VLGEGTLWYLKGSYNVSNISYLDSPLPSLSFISPLHPHFLEELQQVLFFHLHSCVHIFYTIFILLPPFPATFPLPLVQPSLLGKIYSALLFFHFGEEKREKDKPDIFACLR